MKNFLTLSVLGAALSVSLLSCSVSTVNTSQAAASSDERVVHTYDFKQFSGLSAAQDIHVVYTPTTSGEVSIKADIDPAYEPYFSAEVSGGMLKFYFKNKTMSINRQKPAVVTVTGPALNRLEVSSAADIELTAPMHCNGRMAITASSSGNVWGSSLSCTDLNVSLRSSADVKFDNVSCADVAIGAASSADCTLGTLDCKNVALTGSSSADVTINRLTCDNAAVNLSSSAEGHLSGNCKGGAAYKASSSATIDARELRSQSATAEARSGGEIYCHPQRSLVTSTSSGGEVRYKGSPTVSSNNNRSGGSTEHIAE